MFNSSLQNLSNDAFKKAGVVMSAKSQNIISIIRIIIA